MATYYISSTVGNDANNGLGPDASHASNKPWASLTKLLGATGFSSGDIAYVAPGTQREVVTVNMTSAVAETQVLADPTNAQGFKNGSGVRLDPGYVVWTAYTTNDTTAPNVTNPLTLNGRDFLTFEGFYFQDGASSGSVEATTSHSTNITFRRCVFSLGPNSIQYGIIYNGLANTQAVWLVERCIFVGGFGILLTLPTSGSADYDINFIVRNCLFDLYTGGTGLLHQTTGALAFKAGGTVVLSCTFNGGNVGVYANSANLSTSVPIKVRNCYLTNRTNNGLVATTLGQITEDYNILHCVAPRSNVSVGANSSANSSRSPALDWGYSWLLGFQTRPFWMPRSGSPLLGFGNDTSPTPPTTDLVNRPRPAGGASTLKGVGAFERHDTAAKETTTVQAGTAAFQITGPGDQDLLVPVSAASTDISIKARYDTSHGTTNKPQVLLLANGEIGVAAQTLTMSASADTWETLTFASFTPTGSGVVTLRLVSRAGAGSGKAFFDTASVPNLVTTGLDYFRQGEPFPAITAGAAAQIVQVSAVVEGDDLHLRRGETWSIPLTDLGSLSGATQIWFTIKAAFRDTDAESIVQVRLSGGLVYLNGAAGTASDGTLVVDDEIAGDITVTVNAAATVGLSPMLRGYYDVQTVVSGIVTTRTSGAVYLSSDVTRAIS